jgi:hypothetical protein
VPEGEDPPVFQRGEAPFRVHQKKSGGQTHRFPPIARKWRLVAAARLVLVLIAVHIATLVLWLTAGWTALLPAGLLTLLTLALLILPTLLRATALLLSAAMLITLRLLVVALLIALALVSAGFVILV